MPDFSSKRLGPMVDRLKLRLGTKVERSAGDPTHDTLEREGQRLERVREQLAEEQEKLAALREKLARARREAVSSSLLGEGEPVFFLTGRAKSGTSWLMRILDSHPEVLCKGEGLFFGRDYLREKAGGGEKAKVQRRSLHGVIAGSEA